MALPGVRAWVCAAKLITLRRQNGQRVRSMPRKMPLVLTSARSKLQTADLHAAMLVDRHLADRRYGG
jgi:hypothetical protein